MDVLDRFLSGANLTGDELSVVRTFIGHGQDQAIAHVAITRLIAEADSRAERAGWARAALLYGNNPTVNVPRTPIVYDDSQGRERELL